ncbi:MAG: endonuclease/exonuclease/phosphatase (EEP) superfamily protein YafD [Glaciecola sp.]|jgi:endonuclease/exonuclease/phosphatase (EEP) superfamily protein YafD
MAFIKKKLSLFLKITIPLYVLFLGFVLLGRNHFFLGSALIFGRWFYLMFSAYLMYRVAVRECPNWIIKAVRISLILFILEWGWASVNKTSLDNDSTDTELSLMSYNVFFKNRSPKGVIKTIKQADPDILVVQELTPQWKSILGNSIGHDYRFRKLIPMRGTHGIGIYSKHPIVAQTVCNNKSNRPFAQIIELKIQNKLIQLINVHLASPGVAVENPDNFMELYKNNYNTRASQITVISKIVKKSETKFDAQILIGDLNTTSYEPIFRDAEKDWCDLNQKVGKKFNFTFPNSSKIDPLLTLDYIMLRGNVLPVKFKVLKSGTSDHFPIIGNIKI